MRKNRAAVNRILKTKGAVGRSLSAVAFLLLFAGSLVAAERGHLLAEWDGNTYRVISRSGADLKAPVGSLLKPFAAIYLLENGVDYRQEIFCPALKKQSAALRCWTTTGHGAMTIGKALVQSCNYYFLSQFRGRDLGAYENWLRRRYDWPENLHITKPVNVYGFDLEYGIDAERLLSMYEKLLREASAGNAPAAVVTQALADICLGTLADFCRKINRDPKLRLTLGKTGTVREGDRNFGVVLLLLDHLPQQKKLLLIAYEKGKTGSQVSLQALRHLEQYGRKKRN